MRYFLLAAIFIATGCADAPETGTLPLPTQAPAVAIASNAIPTTVPSPTVRSTPTALPVQTNPKEPTPSVTPSVYPTSPLATPTLSLLAVLTQTLIVTSQQTLSNTAFLPLITKQTLPETGALTDTLSPTSTQSVVDIQPTAPITVTATPAVRLVDNVADLHTDGISRTVQIPILMYHHLGIPPANADIYRRDLSVEPDLFAAQLERMQNDGYTIISLYDLAAHLLQGVTLPPKPVVLSFDDGYRDNYENAFPILRDRQLTATFFIVTDFIDRERPEYLTWDMVREMYAGGMSIEVHGVDHTTLRGRSQADLEYQALRSYETIQDRLGIRPRFLSYPAGEFDQKAMDMFRSANYWAAVTTVQGVTQQSEKIFELQRIRIRGTTTPDDLIRLLEADW